MCGRDAALRSTRTLGHDMRLHPMWFGISFHSPLFAGVLAVCSAILILLPNQSPLERFTSPAFCVLATGISYLFWKLVLSGFALVTRSHFSSLGRWYIYVVFYGVLGGAALFIILLPFQWRDLLAEGIDAPLVVAMLPVSLSTAVAASDVFKKYYVVA
jgi:hypothetical protein